MALLPTHTPQMYTCWSFLHMLAKRRALCPHLQFRKGCLAFMRVPMSTTPMAAVLLELLRALNLLRICTGLSVYLQMHIIAFSTSIQSDWLSRYVCQKREEYLWAVGHCTLRFLYICSSVVLLAHNLRV